MKKRSKPVRRMYATTNPNYPGTEDVMYRSRRLCDCLYGRTHTVPVISITFTAAAIVAMVEKVARSMAAQDGNDWNGYPVMDVYGKRARTALAAIVGRIPKSREVAS
jgi:hypothetical protein